jgi:SAM-dependent methyltransferase
VFRAALKAIAAVGRSVRQSPGGPKEKASFEFQSAQRYEMRSASAFMDEHFEQYWMDLASRRADGELTHDSDDAAWFRDDKDLWDAFIRHTTARVAMEVGSGPFGYLAYASWPGKRLIVDPLIDEYVSYQKARFGKTLFTGEFVLFNKTAETFVPELEGAVDGFIVCRNCLDHTEDPLSVIVNISRYAAPGSYLLLWSDLWHLGPLDEGHRNITRSERVIRLLLEAVGYSVIKDAAKIRSPHEAIEYGCIAVMSSKDGPTEAALRS